MKFIGRVIFALLVTVASKAFAEPRLTYVNSRPQFNMTEEFFALYIGVWRGFDAM